MNYFKANYIHFIYQSIEIFDWTFFVNRVTPTLSLHQKQKQVESIKQINEYGNNS